jgi:hypothetical protein
LHDCQSALPAIEIAPIDGARKRAMNHHSLM